MKKVILSLVIIGTGLFASPVFSQGQIKDSLGLPGDNFNLYAVLDMFQQCKTLEEFEGKINASDSKINNLDLNGDNKIDYIKVVDNGQGTMHAIVLKDEINDHEMQDVAVIEVDKDANGKVKIQVVGDEQLYGKNYIVEPKDQSPPPPTSTPNPGYSGPTGGTTVINNNYYNNDDYYRNNVYTDPYYGGRAVAYVPIDNWFMWDYLYAPGYAFYVSPYHYGYYPTYWNPWTPLYYHEYYGYHYQQYGYYQRTYEYRAPAANAYYGQRRSVSTTVTQRTREHAYTNTYSHRELMNRAVEERRSVNETRAARRPANENENRNREPNRNNAQRENENRNVNGNQERRENNAHENKARSEDNYKAPEQRKQNSANENPPKNENRQEQNNTQRNENNSRRQEGNNNNKQTTTPKQSRSERKAAAKPAPKEEPKHTESGERKK